MSSTVFWSWQSDRDERVNRHLIREALVIALNDISQGSNVEERLEVDHDTRGLPGSPDIVASILDKIDKSAVFVADITPIAKSEKGKHLPNPNVLIELGYAKRGLGAPRIVTVWNTSYTNCKVDDLPFDLRFRRGPICYNLAPGAERSDLADARAILIEAFKQRVGACLDALPKIAEDRSEWHPHTENDPSSWIPSGSQIKLNEDWGSGVRKWKSGPRWYARILPQNFDPASMDNGASAPLINDYGGYSRGNTTGGVLTYSGSVRSDAPAELDGATMWFRNTGEIWAAQTGILTEYRGLPTFLGDYVPSKWLEMLRRGLAMLENNGGEGPYRVILGVNGLDGLHWQTGNHFGGTPPIALQDWLENEFSVASSTREDWLAEFLDTWSSLRRIFSLPPADVELVESFLARYGS